MRQCVLIILCGLPTVHAGAQEAETPGEIVGQALDSLHLRNAPPPPADFVRESRPEPGGLDYTPLTSATRDPAKKKKTQAELETTQSDLEAALGKNRRAAASVSRPDVVAPVVKKKSPAQN